jgi:uncharacterized protein (TIGR01777 family)
MQVVIAGSHGFLGGALTSHLVARGHQVRRLVRRPIVSPVEISWEPDDGRLDPADLVGVDAVVNLGGVGLGDHRWTSAYRRRIISSRTQPTRLLATTLGRMTDGPSVLLQASAVGIYGGRADEVLDETSEPGDGFLAEVVKAWESATEPARDRVRVALMRTGIVLAPGGGALRRLLPLTRLGLAGPLGDGRNVWSWITLADHVRAVEHLLTSSVDGPVNLTAPEPATQREVVASIARHLHRPAVLQVPRFVLRAALGGFADDVLSSQRALPRVLLSDGFTFRYPDLESAAAWVTADRARRR